MKRKKCPYCGEDIAESAKKCMYCGEWLVASESHVPESPVSTDNRYVEESHTNCVEESVKNCMEDSYSQNIEPISFFKAYFVNPYIRRYADFRGYTSRKSFWLSYVAVMILSLGLSGLIFLLSSFGTGSLIGACVVSGVVGLALLVPGLALCVRRLRDAGKNPLLILLALIPALGGLILLLFFCQESKYEDTEEKGDWQLSDWIVTGVCAVVLALGIFFSLKGIGGSDSFSGFDADDITVYDDNDFSYANEDMEEEEVAYVEEEDDDYRSDFTDEEESHGNVKGYVIAANGKEYPFRIEFDSKGDHIYNARYYNINYKAETSLPDVRIDGDELIFSGKINGDKLQIRFSTSYPYEGTMIVGGNISEIRMEL